MIWWLVIAILFSLLFYRGSCQEAARATKWKPVFIGGAFVIGERLEAGAWVEILVQREKICNMRNKGLELNNVSPGRWLTTDGRFGVFKRQVAVNDPYVTEKWKFKLVYAVHDLRGWNGPKEFMELAPEIARLDRYADVFPWIGSYTGEGSFEHGNPDKKTAAGS